MLGITLRYPYEVRDEALYFEDIPDIKVPDEMLKLAEHIVDTKARHFDPAKFEDHYETALVALLKDKQAGRQIEPVQDTPRPHTVVNLMDALRKSLRRRERRHSPKARLDERLRRRSEVGGSRAVVPDSTR